MVERLILTDPTVDQPTPEYNHFFDDTSTPVNSDQPSTSFNPVTNDNTTASGSWSSTTSVDPAQLAINTSPINSAPDNNIPAGVPLIKVVPATPVEGLTSPISTDPVRLTT